MSLRFTNLFYLNHNLKINRLTMITISDSNKNRGSDKNAGGCFVPRNDNFRLSRLHFRQIFMYKTNSHRPFAYGGCYTVHGAGAHIACGKYAGTACFQ